VAIVLAMGVVALAALAATGMMVSQSTWSRQAELRAGHAQSQLVLRAGLDWARALLGDDSRAGNVDHLGEPWALRLPPIPVENGSLAGRIEDEQGKFNLNNIVKDGKVDAARLGDFGRLLWILELPPELADALADWVDADGEPLSAMGADDAYYLSLRPPYLAANRPLVDLAELALVRGFDARVRARLRPFVTALPRLTALNVNTASPEVIAAIVEDLPVDAARALVEQRARMHFRDVAEFDQALERFGGGLSVTAERVSVRSDFFAATMQVNLGGSQASGSALLARASGGWPAVVWRKYP